MIRKRKVVPIEQNRNSMSYRPGQHVGDRDNHDSRTNTTGRLEQRPYAQNERDESRHRGQQDIRHGTGDRDTRERSHRYSDREEYDKEHLNRNQHDNHSFSSHPRNDTEYRNDRENYPSGSGRQNRDDFQDYQEPNRNPQNEDPDAFRSPMIRKSFPNLSRDEQGPYFRDEQGRQIRGAEAGEEEPYRNKYGRYSSENDRDQRNHYKSGRSIRESSRHYNKNQPGSRPYGGTYRRS